MDTIPSTRIVRLPFQNMTTLQKKLISISHTLQGPVQQRMLNESLAQCFKTLSIYQTRSFYNSLENSNNCADIICSGVHGYERVVSCECHVSQSEVHS